MRWHRRQSSPCRRRRRYYRVSYHEQNGRAQPYELPRETQLVAEHELEIVGQRLQPVNPNESDQFQHRGRDHHTADDVLVQ